MVRYVISLDSPSALQEAWVGGKGASLAWLRRNSFNVPPGFVVTAATFRDFLADFGIRVLAQRMEWTQSDLERIHELITACRIPDHLARPMVRAYQKLGGRVAVRSSMIGEDTRIASFAGQLDTFLNVQGEQELLRAIRGCWASLFNWRLLSYLRELEAISPEAILESFSLAVVVQRMVDAQAAGVAFSADPVTGQRCVIVEAVHGLGDALVQGLVEPDRYSVDARGVLAESSPSNADAPALGDEQILCLAGIVRRVASRIGTPQDVEWAWDGTDFHLLQSRPITSLAGGRIYSTNMVAEMLPGLIKPLVWSVSTTSKLKNVLGRIFTELIGPNDFDFTLLAKRIHSRVYADNTMLGQLCESLGLPANFFQVMSHDEQVERHRPPPFNTKTLRSTVRLLRFAWRHSRVTDEVSDFIERHDHDLEPHRRADYSSETPQALLVQANQLARLYSETMWFNFIGPLNMMFRNRLLGQLVGKWVPDVAPGDLVRGLTGLKSLESNHALHNLAAQARELDGEIQCLLVEADDRTIRTELSASKEGQALVHEMDGFLDHFGFLSASGTDLSRTTWGENPTLIWQAIGRMAADPREHDASENVEEVRENARRRVRASLAWARRVFFSRLLASTVTHIRLRERSSFLISEDSFQMRRIFLALADQLIARGDLNQRDDVFYLSLDELQQLVDGELGPKVAAEWIAARRADMEFDAQIELPDTIFGDHVPTSPIVPAEGQEYLVGISASSGLAQGEARIVLDPVEVPVTLTGGDILVVPFSDMSWTPLFSGIGGVVTETGGQLSHSAIVAREYGLPAVVNVKYATRLIRDGQSIAVDGSNGRVYLK